MNLKFAFMFVLAVLSASAQTNAGNATNWPGGTAQQAPLQLSQTNQTWSVVEHAQQIRAACIQGRRYVCGKILKVLPEGLVVESGYTNLLRAPLNRSWLVPGTVSASRAENLIEGNTPESICVGLVFLSNIPKPRLAKAKLYDYVIVPAYPAGQHTYTSVGDIQRTVRRFSYSLEAAVEFNVQVERDKMNAHADESK